MMRRDGVAGVESLFILHSAQFPDPPWGDTSPPFAVAPTLHEGSAMRLRDAVSKKSWTLGNMARCHDLNGGMRN